MKQIIDGDGGVKIEYTPNDDVRVRKLRHNATCIEFSEKDFAILCANFLSKVLSRQYYGKDNAQ